MPTWCLASLYIWTVTQVANLRGFNLKLKNEWRRLKRECRLPGVIFTEYQLLLPRRQ